MNNPDINQMNWEKMNGLIPAVIQHAETGNVLMLGYMNKDALSVSLATNELTFYSRSKQRLWRKGETSGNTMTVKQITSDCDNDSLLVQVIPKGSACHLGTVTCFQPETQSSAAFLDQLIKVIADRATSRNSDSYTAELLATGINRCAQKVGEEAVETVIAAVSNNKKELISEAADLFFHLLVLLQASQVNFYSVLACLQARHNLKAAQ